MSGGTNVVPQSNNNINSDSGYDTVNKQVAAIRLTNVQVDSNGYYSGSQLVFLDGTTAATIQGSPDGGVTLKILKTASDGSLFVNTSLQAGTSLAGGMMDYREMVARGLIGNVKYLTGKVTLGTTQSAAITFVDQFNAAYTTVTNGKTLYISGIDATCDIGATSAAQTSLLTIADGTNLKYQSLVSQSGAARILHIPITLASTSTLTVKAGASNLGTPAGSLYVTLLGWEE